MKVFTEDGSEVCDPTTSMPMLSQFVGYSAVGQVLLQRVLTANMALLIPPLGLVLLERFSPRFKVAKKQYKFMAEWGMHRAAGSFS